VTSSAGLQIKPGSIGKVLDGMEVRLVDDQGDDVVSGDPGEIWVRGPNVFAGYFEDPEATARALTADGWLRTGDIAVTDGDGYLYPSIGPRPHHRLGVQRTRLKSRSSPCIRRRRRRHRRRAHPYWGGGEGLRRRRRRPPDGQPIAHCGVTRPLQVPFKILFVDERAVSPASCRMRTALSTGDEEVMNTRRCRRAGDDERSILASRAASVPLAEALRAAAIRRLRAPDRGAAGERTATWSTTRLAMMMTPTRRSTAASTREPRTTRGPGELHRRHGSFHRRDSTTPVAKPESQSSYAAPGRHAPPPIRLFVSRASHGTLRIAWW
jgi:hypothetical protein